MFSRTHLYIRIYAHAHTSHCVPNMSIHGFTVNLPITRLPVMYQINGQEAGMQPRTLCQV